MAALASTSTPTRPNIIAITVDSSCAQMVQSIYAPMFNALQQHSNLTFSTNTDSAMASLNSLSPRAILLMDPFLIRPKPAYRALAGALASYVHAGGRVVLCGVFSSMVSSPDFNAWLLRRWGLHWELGAYHRVDNCLGEAELRWAPALLERFSMKAVSLKGVRREARLYVPAEGARTQSFVFPAQEVQNKEQAAVAWEMVGSGWLGYVGDVNCEEGSIKAVVAMCGVRDEKCYGCEKEGSVRCARCTKALYCGKECQKTDWKRHKAICREAAPKA
ncbi:hypothetical protein FN846DRAFT_924693 [Sphaerosporella brunnea]|uniref:MYND-type domain-containing protein n=1 Tax=Sphaerosporella brunnea TaxID=1250544 RepID=A0A5J5FC68_9PEZI|nr:hypothetical protein FN846DRAFT_924693 [Sphaerosporella brunnea]